jgi:hypothetical protein
MSDITHRDIRRILRRIQDRILIAGNAQKEWRDFGETDCATAVGRHLADLCAINAELRGLTANKGGEY